MSMLVAYASSVVGGSPPGHNLNRSLSLLLAGMLGGYLITACPDAYLRLFQNPVLQFGVMLIIFNLDRKSAKVPVLWVVLDALLLVALLQAVVRGSNWWYARAADEAARRLRAAGKADEADGKTKAAGEKEKAADEQAAVARMLRSRWSKWTGDFSTSRDLVAMAATIAVGAVVIHGASG